MKVRIIQDGEWLLLKQIRLDALKDAPYAFSTTYEEACKRPESVWKERTTNGAKGENEVCAIAVDKDSHGVGIAVGLLDPEDKEKTYLVSMWVAKEFRGTDIAKLLLDEITLWSKRIGGKALYAGVTKSNERATAFYLKTGFEKYTGKLWKHPAISSCGNVLVKTV